MVFLELFLNYLESQTAQMGYFFNLFSMGTILSFLMILAGMIIFTFIKKMKSNLKFFKKKKFLPVDKFFQNVLYDKKIGYYSTNNLLEKKGDFITAPKISNLFSEIIAIWIVSTWQIFGNQKILI